MKKKKEKRSSRKEGAKTLPEEKIFLLRDGFVHSMNWDEEPAERKDRVQGSTGGAR